MLLRRRCQAANDSIKLQPFFKTSLMRLTLEPVLRAQSEDVEQRSWVYVPTHHG